MVSFLHWKWVLLLPVDLGGHFLQPMIVNEKEAYFLEGGGNVNFLCLITNGEKHFLWTTILDGEHFLWTMIIDGMHYMSVIVGRVIVHIL